MMFLSGAAADEDAGGRVSDAQLGFVFINIVQGKTVVTTNAGESDNWGGRLAEGTNLTDEIAEKFINLEDGSIAISLVNSDFVGLIYCPMPGVSENLEALFDSDGIPKFDSTGIDGTINPDTSIITLIGNDLDGKIAVKQRIDSFSNRTAREKRLALKIKNLCLPNTLKKWGGN